VIQKPTADTYRIDTAGVAALSSPPYTFACFIRWDSVAAPQRAWDGFELGVGGFQLDLESGTSFWKVQYARVGGLGFVTITSGSAPDVGQWYFFLFSIDAAGNWVRQIGSSRASGSSTAPAAGPVTEQMTLGGRDDGAAPAQMSIASVQIYDRILTEAEAAAIRLQQGREHILDGRQAYLPCDDLAPGADTDAAAPVDTTGRVWAVAGTGDAFLYSPSAVGPLRRRAQ
jgi:hypothetical protein